MDDKELKELDDLAHIINDFVLRNKADGWHADEMALVIIQAGYRRQAAYAQEITALKADIERLNYEYWLLRGQKEV